MDKNKYLPIGSVVKIKNEKQLFMITGYKIFNQDKIYDYSACFFPNGILSFEEFLCFDQNKIESILFEGYKNNEYDKINDILNN